MGDRALQLTEQAYQRREIKELLNGEAGYSYTPKYSPATTTDLALLLPHGVYGFQKRNPEAGLPKLLEEAVTALAGEYEGLVSAASFLLIEALSRSKGTSPLQFALEPIAEVLRESIQNYRHRLEGDRAGPGHAWEDGLYGELRHLARNTIDCGGPDFFGV